MPSTDASNYSSAMDSLSSNTITEHFQISNIAAPPSMCVSHSHRDHCHHHTEHFSSNHLNSLERQQQRWWQHQHHYQKQPALQKRRHQHNVALFTIFFPILLLSSLFGIGFASKSGQSTTGGGGSSSNGATPLIQPLALQQQQQLMPCAISEHTCNNGKCVPLNKFCDNINDCGDSSDEPRFCTSK